MRVLRRFRETVKAVFQALVRHRTATREKRLERRERLMEADARAWPHNRW